MVSAKNIEGSVIFEGDGRGNGSTITAPGSPKSSPVQTFSREYGAEYETDHTPMMMMDDRQKLCRCPPIAISE